MPSHLLGLLGAMVIASAAVSVGPQRFPADALQLPPTVPGESPAPSTAMPDRHVVCGLTMISPRNPDPKMVAPGQQLEQAPPANGRGASGVPKPQGLADPQGRATMRIVQPRLCWDPAPVAQNPVGK
jgi:hypothetical protein